MKLSLLRACWFYSVITLTSTISVFSQVGTKNTSDEKTVKYINGYTVITAERPPIDLEFVSEDDYEAGKLFIKVKSGVEKSLGESIVFTSKTANFSTGVKGIDNLIKGFGVNQYKPILHELYSNDLHTKSSKAKHDAWEFNLWYELTLDKNADIIKVVKEFSALDEVDLAEPVFKKVRIEPVARNPITPTKSGKVTSNDNFFSLQWGYKNTGQNIRDTYGVAGIDIKLEEAWAIEMGNSNVIVSIHDGGIDFSHPDLAANMWTGIGPDGQNTNPDDHGTHVAGTVAAVTNNEIGVAGIAGGDGSGNGVRLMSVDIFEGSLSTYNGYVYAADRGSAISQNSWGYENAGVYNTPDLLGIDYFNANGGGEALNGGGIVIFAAGNDNENSLRYPGCYSGTFAVASHDNQGKKSSFSNYAPWVHVSAPGTNIASTAPENGYVWMSGTSMACPHVSGIAALVVSKYYGELTKDDLWFILTEGVDDIYSENPYYQGLLGTGRVNAYKTLMATENRFLPKVETLSITSILHNEVLTGGNITRNGGFDITARGIVWGTTENPSLDECDGFTVDGEGDGEYVSKMTGFSESTRYYIRAYATNSQGTTYGKSVSFFSLTSVSFKIVDESRNPLSNVEVTLGEEIVTTNASGEATFYRNYGTYTYSVSRTNYQSTGGSLFISTTSVNEYKLALVAPSSSVPEIIGALNACSGSEIIYRISLSQQGTWEMEGGGIIGSTNQDFAIAKWTSSTGKGIIRFRIIAEDGFQTTYQKEITINTNHSLPSINKPKISVKGTIPILICTTPDMDYKWYKNGVPIEGATEQHFAPRNQSGRFHVQTTDHNQCHNTSNELVHNSNSFKQGLVSTYPNPNSGQFTINYQSETVGAGTLTVSNAQGKVVHQESFIKSTEEFSNQLSLTGLPKGIYIVTITTGNEAPVNTKITIY